MSVTGAVTLDFVEHLHALGLGWTVTPMVVHEDQVPQHRGYPNNSTMHWTSPPPGQSPRDFYSQHPPQGEFGYVLVKKANCKLRVIQLFVDADAQKVFLSYYRANGFKQKQIVVDHDDEPLTYVSCGGFKARLRKRLAAPPQGFNCLRLLRMYRAVTGRKKRVFQLDYFDLGAPVLNPATVVTVAAVLDKSFRHYKQGREPFDSGACCLVIDVEGHDFVMDPWLISVR